MGEGEVLPCGELSVFIMAMNEPRNRHVGWVARKDKEMEDRWWYEGEGN